MTQTNFDANKEDTHLQNILRQMREKLIINNCVQAYIQFNILERYLHGLTMDGKPWPKYEEKPLEQCVAGRDGECNHKDCPQNRDNEPHKSGRSCPLYNYNDEDE